MKKVTLIISALFLVAEIFAFGTKEIPNWATTESMYENVKKQLDHDLEKYEQIIIDTTYLYYYNKCNGNWTDEIWNVAVAKAVSMCRNNIAVAAAKSGVFGEKLLRTLAVTAEDAVSGFNNWIESGSQKFEERHNP